MSSSNDPAVAALKKDDDEEDTASSSDDEDNMDNDMPLFKYARLMGSLPRDSTNKFSSPCTCAAMGKVVIAPEVLETGDGSSLRNRQSDLIYKYPHYIMAIGFENGQVSLVDARTGVAIAPPGQLEKEARGHAVVHVALDASGTFLAALYANGACVVWEFKYAASATIQSNTTPEATADQQHVFSFFNLGKSTSTDEQEQQVRHSEHSTSVIPSLKTSFCQASRITYPASFGRPTTCAMDPSFKRRSQKILLTGFKDGRLVMTKRGFFARRTDAVLHQGSEGEIQAIAWRASLVAWADGSGIKLFDVDNMTRIAHIDRPTGARPTLYPTISSLLPSLVFETSDSLLCAWGDCLMTLSIKEKQISSRQVVSSDVGGTAALETTTPATVTKRQTVECSMAWELDCVACGVVPLDAEHVAVLGLVPGDNDLELHVMSRSEGSVIYADVLPFPPEQAASGFALLSSFALPRMEDAVEAEEERNFDEEEEDIDFQMTLFSTQKTAPFKDPHCKWSLEQLEFEQELQEKHDDDDNDSVDSDDYSFLLRPCGQEPTAADAASWSVLPPIMVICSPSDAVVVRPREVDDAVSHALSAKKYGLALRRALTYKRQLREYDLNELVNEYLSAVLRMKSDNGLSIRRVKLAAQVMPMLLGGNVAMWERWIGEFSKIPGGLFVLREELPVRDPKLPAKVYESTLQTMLFEIEGVLSNKEEADKEEGTLVYPQMMRHFLSALSAWGPTRSLRGNIQFLKYDLDRQQRRTDLSVPLENAVLLDAEKSLDRRLHQSSAGYLQLPSAQLLQNRAGPVAPATRSAVDDSSDSLFSIDNVFTLVSDHAPLLTDKEASTAADVANNHPAMEAMAELCMMKGEYEMALRYCLAIGCLHVTPDLSILEGNAIRAVNNGGKGRKHKANGRDQHGFVLAMIEYQHLHQCLLDETFLSSSINDKAQKLSTPLVALIRLVGLDDAGDFLVEHCTPPPVDHRTTISYYPQPPEPEADTSEGRDSSEALPINVVADQLRPYPKLFHWYLHQVFTRKPEMYVKFPRTAVPPRPVTELHRSHLELYIEYTDKRDSAKSLSGTETYNLERMTTPLLSFLKAALPLGGIRPDEARRLLEAERSGDRQMAQSDVVQFPHYFALELAYVIEHFGTGTEEEANRILDLHLNGSESLMLAVSYAQRNTTYSSRLWKTLIDHCLERPDGDESDKRDGSLFGGLLECAALCGADLAHLVKKIPQGMKIEGLRPRLVAAVADYRWKLKMHEAASSIGTKERVVLLRELAHRSRRGMRFSQAIADAYAPPPLPAPIRQEEQVGTLDWAEEKVNEGGPSKVIRPSERPNRYRLSFAVPIR